MKMKSRKTALRASCVSVVFPLLPAFLRLAAGTIQSIR